MDIDSILALLQPILDSIVGNFSSVASIIGVLLTATLIIKPLEVAAKAIVGLTSTLKDDEFLNKILSSKAYQLITKLSNFLLNIKLPEKK